MRLLKIIFVVFLIYFIRRFVQLYRTMKAVQEQQMRNQATPNTTAQRQDSKTINADFKVVD